MAVKIFFRNKAQMRIRLLMDNVSAVYYINKMGVGGGWGRGNRCRFPALAQLAIDLWQWSLNHNLVLQAQHILGVFNVRADQETKNPEPCSITTIGNYLRLQKFGFINGVDNVNWPPYRDSKS